MEKEAINEDIFPGKNQTPITHAELLLIVGDVIRSIHEKCTHGRFRDIEAEKAKDSKLRILIQAISVCDNLIQNKSSDDGTGKKAAIDELMDYLRNEPAEMVTS